MNQATEFEHLTPFHVAGDLLEPAAMGGKVKMTDAEKIRFLDDTILQLEIAQERATVMAEEIGSEYFDLNDDDHKLYYYDKASIEFDILFDYVVRMGKYLENARKQFREWREVGSPDKSGTESEERED